MKEFAGKSAESKKVREAMKIAKARRSALANGKPEKGILFVKVFLL